MLSLLLCSAYYREYPSVVVFYLFVLHLRESASANSLKCRTTFMGENIFTPMVLITTPLPSLPSLYHTHPFYLEKGVWQYPISTWLYYRGSCEWCFKRNTASQE